MVCLNTTLTRFLTLMTNFNQILDEIQQQKLAVASSIDETQAKIAQYETDIVDCQAPAIWSLLDGAWVQFPSCFGVCSSSNQLLRWCKNRELAGEWSKRGDGHRRARARLGGVPRLLCQPGAGTPPGPGAGPEHEGPRDGSPGGGVPHHPRPARG